LSLFKGRTSHYVIRIRPSEPLNIVCSRVYSYIAFLDRRLTVKGRHSTSIQNQCNLGTHASHARKARRMAAEAHLATALLYSSKQEIRCTPKFTYLQKKLGIYTPTRGRERKPKRLNLPFIHFFSSYLQEGFWLSIKHVLGCLLQKTKTDTS
jgi:hypothetical protein